MVIKIRPITPDLIEGFHRSLDIVARERRYLTLLEAPPLVETREFVFAGQKKGDPRLVATTDDDVVGWCDVSRHYFPSHSHRGTLGMGVLPEFRGQGLGSRLMAVTLNEAWGIGLSRVELSVHEDNAAALALYEKAGFVREGIVRDASLIDGHYRDAITMAILRRPL